MGFHYRKNKHQEESGSQWTSMSDLFLGLSVIFLLLYVAASLKQGTTGAQQAQEYKRLAKEAEELRQQIKVYNTLKQDYVDNGATDEEQQVYKELMNKLTLLQDDAKDEKDRLREEAKENEKKEAALNKYQQMIRNIINANMVAQARIKKRDTIIEKKDDTISQNKEEISQLQQNVAEKRRELERGEKKMANMKYQLNQRMKELQESYQNQEISKKTFEQQKAKLQSDTAQRLANLRKENEKVQSQLSQVADELTSAKTDLTSAQKTIAQKDQERDSLSKELEGTKSQAAQQAAVLQANFAKERDRDRKNFEAALAKEKLTGEQKAAREAAFRADAERKAKDMNDRVAALQGKMKETEGELAKAREQANARKALTQAIIKNFNAKGIKADVDPNSGDVLLSFGDQYFDTGRSDLKPKMRQILEKAVPVYSQSLFTDPKISQKIASVEIVGFASPTYQNKVVDPSSLNPEDRQAVNYNLDLSYARARSIFNYIFDTNRMTFSHQKKLLPLVKVTGRSFLTESKKDSNVVPGEKTRDFCEKYDCVKAQRVIIKFTLKD